MTAAGISLGRYRSGDLSVDAERMGAAIERAERPGALFVEADLDDWHRVLDVNLTGTYLALRACVPRMIEGGRGGTVITISSIAGKHPDAGPLAYVVSKAGVWVLTKKAARELASAGIRVNAIGPGFVATNMTRIFEQGPADFAGRLMAQVPLGRVGQPVEIANTAVFLASDEASYFTGEILHPDGGFFTE